VPEGRALARSSGAVGALSCGKPGQPLTPYELLAPVSGLLVHHSTSKLEPRRLSFLLRSGSAVETGAFRGM